MYGESEKVYVGRRLKEQIDVLDTTVGQIPDLGDQV